jgi:hypothetical protein
MFLFFTVSLPVLWFQEPEDNGGSFPGVKWLEHEADRWPPTSAEIKNLWGYASTPTYVDFS